MMLSTPIMLRLEGVEKTYRVGNENYWALRDVDLKIDEGSFLAFVGPSGSGKTTLLNLIGGLDRPTKGEIFFRNSQLSKFSHDELAGLRRDEFGFIFQSHNLLPVYNVYENVLFPLLLKGEKESSARDRVMTLIEIIGLSEFSGKRPSELSGGQCQRAAIARALVKEPILVLADEPTANLDSENSCRILELMRDLNTKFGSAFLFSTHDEKVTRYVKRQIRLVDGHIQSDQIRRNHGDGP
tara:strand:+ start:1227 stop:1946 length:720 start_codon:yes stop_codon:yes gene_type:complete